VQMCKCEDLKVFTHYSLFMIDDSR